MTINPSFSSKCWLANRQALWLVGSSRTDPLTTERHFSLLPMRVDTTPSDNYFNLESPPPPGHCSLTSNPLSQRIPRGSIVPKGVTKIKTRPGDIRAY